jgi:phosphoglycerol transferase MdoB-like AlkP superfamily enzyme
VTVGKNSSISLFRIIDTQNTKQVFICYIALSIGSILKLILDVDIPKAYLMFITLGITLFHGYLNMRDMGGLAILNQWSVFWSCTGLLIIITALSTLAPHQSASWVFTNYQNQTGFDNPGYVLILGMIGAAYSLFGKRNHKYSYRNNM